MKNKFFITFFFLLAASQLYAVPVRQGVLKTFTQPDGSTLTLMLNGDEKFHYWSTADGIPVVEGMGGYYYYVKKIQGKELVPGKHIARNPEQRSASDMEYTDRILPLLQQSIRQSCSPARGLGDGSVPTTGTLKGLVILAQFADREFTDICTNEQMKRQLNEEGYSDYGMTGSARDYFIDQSAGLFTPTFDVVGPVTVSRDMAYYGQDNNGAYDIRLNQFIKEACELADEQEGVDFTDYDNNDDGVADLVFVIYAGYAQSSGAPSYTIWPQMWFLEELGTQLTLDGVKINCFACSSELAGISGKELAGIGPFCHEFSHTLGLADIYNYNGKLSTGSWNIMDVGLYNNNSCTPAGYTSFEKMALGWLEPTELTEAGTRIELQPLDASGQAYKLTYPNNENEFFLFENRQQTSKWDQYIGSSGMIVLHVNYDEAVWNENDVNTDPNNMRMHIVPANGNYSSGSQLSSIPFPGSQGKTAFTPLSSPSSVFSDGYVLDMPITGIREEGANILFDFLQRLEPPVALDATILTETSFTANWEKGEGAVKYNILLVNQETDEEKTIANITRTRFTFDNLEPEAVYTYKVKSIGEELSSPYSREITVDLKMTGIEDAGRADFSISWQNGTLFIQSASTVRIFDLQGRMLYNLPAEKAAGGVDMPQGIYIIRTGEAAKKVALY